MDIKLLETIMLAMAAMIAAGMFIAKYRRFFERKSGEPWPLFLQRAREEMQKDLEAKQTMFGTKSATLRANLLTFGLMIVLLFVLLSFVLQTSSIYPPIMGLLSLYLLIGFFISRSTAKAAKTAEHARLSIMSRFSFRLYFAWTWIFHARRK